jgi:NAD(P)-dependent dehydrogenase (short-subunit alcohol dehydrogenase family)
MILFKSCIVFDISDKRWVGLNFGRFWEALGRFRHKTSGHPGVASQSYGTDLFEERNKKILLSRTDLNFQTPNSWGSARAYSQSKLSNILHAKKLARDLKDSGIAVFSLHPGVICEYMHFMTGVYTKGSYFYVYWSVTRLRGERV